jgi:hypothetical protein
MQAGVAVSGRTAFRALLPADLADRRGNTYLGAIGREIYENVDPFLLNQYKGLCPTENRLDEPDRFAVCSCKFGVTAREVWQLGPERWAPVDCPGREQI